MHLERAALIPGDGVSLALHVEMPPPGRSVLRRACHSVQKGSALSRDASRVRTLAGLMFFPESSLCDQAAFRSPQGETVLVPPLI